MKNRTISVIIPTCDRINKLRLAINNVKNQSTKVNEIIIVNNGKKKINKDKLPKLKYLKLYNIKSYVGASKARNFGLKKNKSSYVAFHDDDDLWNKNYISNFIKNINKKFDCYLGISKSYKKNRLVLYKNATNKLNFKNIFLNNPGISGSNIIIKNKIKKEKIYFDENLKTAEDKALIFDMLLKKKKIKVISGSYVIYDKNKDKKERLSSKSNVHSTKLYFFKKYSKYVDLKTKLRFIKKYLYIYLKA